MEIKKENDLAVSAGSPMPEVRGAAGPHGEAYPSCSTPPRTYSRISSLPRCGPIVEFNRRTRFRTDFKCSLKPRECYNRGPRTASS